MVKGFYDCTGLFTRAINATGGPGTNPAVGQIDGVPDLVVLNPLFNSVLMVGNYNTSKYEAYILELDRRYFRNWEMSASYTYSLTPGQAED